MGKRKKRKKNRNTHKGLGTTVFIMFTALLISAGFIPLRHKYFNSVVSDIFISSGADSLSTGGNAVFTPWSGLRVNDMTIWKRVSENERYTVSAEIVKIAYNPIFLIYNYLSRRNRDTADEKDHFLNIYKTPYETISEGLDYIRNIRGLRYIKLVNARILLFDRNRKQHMFDGVSLRIGKNKEKELEGKLKCETINIANENIINSFSALIGVDNSIVHMKKGKGNFPGGRFNIQSGIDLKRSRFLPTDIFLSGLDLNRLAFLEKVSEGNIAGKADLEMRIEGDLTNFDAVKGKGRFRAAPISFKELAFQKSLASALIAPSLSNLQFREIVSDIEIKRGTINIKALGSGEMLNFEASGFFKPSWTMDLDIEGVFTEAFSSKLPGVVTASLDKTEDGGRGFKCRLYGDPSQPVLELDRRIMRSAVGAVFQDVKQGVKGVFRRNKP